MNVADSYRAFVTQRFVQLCPTAAIWVARVLAHEQSRKHGNILGYDQLRSNFKVAFPETSERELQLLRTRHVAAKHHYHIITRYLAGLSKRGLENYADRYVHYTDLGIVKELCDQNTPIILVTPHYGAFVAASIKVIRDFGARKTVNLFFDDPQNNPSNSAFPPIFERLGGNSAVLLNNRRSVVSAVRALKDGQILTMMPDVYNVGGAHVAVPFFGRFTHAMTGTAYFALKSNALLVPVYSYPVKGISCAIDIQKPIKLSENRNFEHALYETTASIFKNIEEQLLLRPEHWEYWSEFHSRFPLPIRVGASDDERIAEIRALAKYMRSTYPHLSQLFDSVSTKTELIT